ncbi:MAG: type II secretion system F family protein [Candidatus Magasanikbacteria bacterium]|nr:type II secretion system F family protein [Candidatus Magasanikbacteria bacterium]MBT6819659.1 type II secretion system F family protein [Candidatus Magasanikbacteria bacterium]
MKKEKKLSPFEVKLNNFVTDHLTRIPLMQKIFFVEHMHTMIHAGLSLVESLNTLSKEIENKKLRKIIGEIKTDIEKGQPLAEVLAKHPKAFPPIYVKMIEAGEIAGKLEESLKQVVNQMQKNEKLISTVRGAMIYPSVIIIAMVAIGIMMVTVVLPKLMLMFKEFDAELPLATRILIAVTDFASDPINMVTIIILLIAFIILFVFSLKKYPKFKRLVHNINLHLPIFGKVIKKINLARFSLTLSSLLKSTIPIVQAVEITSETCGNVLYRDCLRETAEKIKTGSPLSEILRDNTHLFPAMVTEMIMVGEKTGEVNQLLDELAIFYGNEVDKTMKNFTVIIEPVIILALGLAVAGMAVAVIMPMYTLVQAF